MGAEFLFMNDNASPHHANIVDECLQSEDITRMNWPAYSSDLNPIEHVWVMLGRRIAAPPPPPTFLPELRRALLGLNRRRVRQLAELPKHQNCPKLGVDVMLNIWHLNGLLRHLKSPKLGVFSMQLTWRLRDTETIEAAESSKRAVVERAQQRRLIFTKNTLGVFDKAVFEYDETLDYESHKLIKIEAMIRNADFAVLLNGKMNLCRHVLFGLEVALPSIDEPVEPLK
ncbi:transposable element Tcb1 transposase [Trichonephila clavipes]|nr:transposable element Tcb1 transposase [Trichonephila clavipes]